MDEYLAIPGQGDNQLAYLDARMIRQGLLS
jgi:hypothetical protein